MVRRTRTAANGQGSLYSRVDYGHRDRVTGERPVRGTVWVATYWVGEPGIGKRHEVRAKTQREAIASRKAAIVAAEKRGRLSKSFSPDMTLGDLADWWLLNVVAPNPGVRATTARTYRTALNRLGVLSKHKVVNVSAEMLQAWQAKMIRDGLASVTVSKTLPVVGQVLGLAVDHGFLMANPVDRVKRVTKSKVTRYVLTPEESRRLIEHLDGNRYGAVVAILFTEGWRVSEVLGLTWADFDWDAGTVTVRCGVHDLPGVGLAIGYPKTDAARGLKFLGPGTLARLKVRRAAQLAERLAAGPAWPTHLYDGAPVDLTFTTEAGGIVRRQTIDSLLRRSAKVLGLDDHRLGTHTGRRSVITTLSKAGVSREDIGRHVGATVKTIDGYAQGYGDRPKDIAGLAHQLLDVPLQAGRER